MISANLPGVDWFSADDGAAIARDVNDELAAMVRADPDRIAAMAALPLQAPDQAATELERAVGLGLRGTMIYSNVAGRPLDPVAMTDLLDVAVELDVPIAIHPTYPLSASTMDAYALIPALGFLVDTTTAWMRSPTATATVPSSSLSSSISITASLLPPTLTSATSGLIATTTPSMV